MYLWNQNHSALQYMSHSSLELYAHSISNDNRKKKLQYPPPKKKGTLFLSLLERCRLVKGSITCMNRTCCQKFVSFLEVSSLESLLREEPLYYWIYPIWSLFHTSRSRLTVTFLILKSRLTFSRLVCPAPVRTGHQTEVSGASTTSETQGSGMGAPWDRDWRSADWG